MKINPTANNEMLFRDVIEGEVFKFNNSFYIKTEFKRIEDGWINAINLDDGSLCGFDGDRKVFCYPNASINLV